MARLSDVLDAARVVAPVEAKRLTSLIEALAAFSPPENRDVTVAYLMDLTPEDLMLLVRPLMALIPESVNSERTYAS